MSRKRQPSLRESGEAEMQRYLDQVELDDELVAQLEEYIENDVDSADAVDDD